MRLRKGKTLHGGEYTVEKQLRVGLSTVSYLAQRTDGSRWVIKILDPQLLMSLSDTHERDRARTLFRQEAVKLHRCGKTPHIGKAEMPFDEGGLACLPVEYVGGDSLADRPQPMLKEETALNYIQQIGEALTILHKERLIHRDIRPDNIFLRIEGNRVNAVLSGFGLSINCDTELTRTRRQELTSGFSPIELYAHGKPVGEYTDVYSLAATLYQLLTGVVPASATERSLNERAFILPKRINPSITSTTADAIISGMQLLPQDRPQSVDAWLSTLKRGQQKKLRLSRTASKPIDWAKWGVIWTVVGVLVAIGTWAWDRMNSTPGIEVPVPVNPKPATMKETSILPELRSSEPDVDPLEMKP